MATNFKKLKSQIYPFKPEVKYGHIFIATKQQEDKYICTIAKVGSKRSLIKILTSLIQCDEDFKAEFSL